MSVERRAAVFGWVVSLLAHASLFGYVAWRTSTPDLEFEFELPMEVEFGLSEAVTVSSAPAPGAEPVPSSAGDAPRPGPGGAADAGVPLDASVPADAGPGDAGNEPDAGRRRRRPRDGGAPQVAAGPRDEGGHGTEPGQGRGVAFLPAGSQIALRLDMERIRRSPLSTDIRQVLAGMPDWQALLEGSGIDPLEDLDRLLVASPNLERSRLVAAGRSSGDEASVRAAAARLAEGADPAPEWRAVGGVPVVDWRNHDPTPRVLALVGPRHFVIAREQDLPRVLGVASARAARDTAPGQEQQHPADALLSMQEGEGLSFEVEGFRNFARARPGARRSPADVLPVRMRLGLGEMSEGRIGARITGHFDDPDQAAAAVAYWDEARQAYARNVITVVLGLSPILSRLTMRAEGEAMHASVDIELPEMRRLLGLVRGYFEDRARAQQQAPGSAPASAPPPSSPPPSGTAPLDEARPPPSPF
jgi:hypothetical protein